MDQRRNGRRGLRAIAALVCGLGIATAPAALAQDDAEMAKSAGVGIGSAVASLVYAPLKTFYALGGVVVGGLAYAFSGGDGEVARVVLEPSVLGDYVITPDHLSGRDKIEFFGRRDGYDDGYARESRGTTPDVAAAPEGW